MTTYKKTTSSQKDIRIKYENVVDHNDKLGRKEGNIFGLKIFSSPKQKLLNKVSLDIKNKSKTWLVTFNPEMALLASKNKKYFDTLALSDYLVPDGIGVAAALEYQSRLASKKPLTLVNRLFTGFNVGRQVFSGSKIASDWNVYKGRELMIDLCELSSQKGWSVYLLGGTSGVAEETFQWLKRRYPQLKVNYSEGPIIDTFGKPVSQNDEALLKETINSIKEFKPNILFVAYGAPKQDYWISKWIKELPVNFAMGVGGSFDYIAGSQKLPPRFIKNKEFLWRLVTQPTRVNRIFNAAVKFPLKVFKEIH